MALDFGAGVLSTTTIDAGLAVGAFYVGARFDARAVFAVFSARTSDLCAWIDDARAFAAHLANWATEVVAIGGRTLAALANKSGGA